MSVVINNRANNDFPYNLIHDMCSLGDPKDDTRPNEKWERKYKHNAKLRYDLLCLVYATLKKDIYADILILRYSDGMSLSEIGKRYGLTRERVRQLEEYSLKCLWLYENTNLILTEGFRNFLTAETDKAFTDGYHRGYEIGYTEGYHRDNAAPDELKNLPLEELGLSVRLYNCLKRSGIQTFGELASADEDKIMSLRGIGIKTIIELVNFLERHGIDATHYKKKAIGVQDI